MTPTDQVRLLIPDTDSSAELLSDEQIEELLTIEGDSVKLATALALEVIASSEAMVSKKIRTQDLQTDGPAVAKELRERAAVLRATVQASLDDEDNATTFAVGDFVYATTAAEELAEAEAG